MEKKLNRIYEAEVLHRLGAITVEINKKEGWTKYSANKEVDLSKYNLEKENIKIEKEREQKIQKEIISLQRKQAILSLQKKGKLPLNFIDNNGGERK